MSRETGRIFALELALDWRNMFVLDRPWEISETAEKFANFLDEPGDLDVRQKCLRLSVMTSQKRTSMEQVVGSARDYFTFATTPKKQPAKPAPVKSVARQRSGGRSTR